MKNNTDISNIISWFFNLGLPEDKASKIAFSHTGNNLGAFTVSLIVSIIVFIVESLGFIFIRNKLRRIYEPKTYLVSQKKAALPPPSGLFDWIKPALMVSDNEIIKCAGLDAYFFLRFLRIMVYIFGVFSVTITPILIGINASGCTENNKGQFTGLNRLSWGSLSFRNHNLYWIHLICSFIAIIFLINIIHKEQQKAISIRQTYLTSKCQDLYPSFSSLLILHVPPEMLNGGQILKAFGFLSNKISKIWIVHDYEPLLKLYKKRQKLVHSIEKELCYYIKNVCRLAHLNGIENTIDFSKPIFKQEYLLKRKSYLFFTRSSIFSRKAHIITNLIEKLKTLDIEIDNLLQDDYPPSSSIFLQFTSPYYANLFSQVSIHSKPGMMSPKYYGVSPNDINWDHLRRSSWVWQFVVYIFNCFILTALCLWWTIPVSAITYFFQFENLKKSFPFLNDVEGAHVKMITTSIGFILPLALAFLLSIVPSLLAKFIDSEMIPLKSEAELKLQNRYFIFLFIQVFLVVTVSSGFNSTVLILLKDPINSPLLLAENLPQSANFFISYIIVRSLMIGGAELLQLNQLISLFVFGSLFDDTPRKKFKKLSNIDTINWGSIFPIYTILAVIGIVYSIIAPLVNIVSVFCFSFLYVIYRYNLIYVKSSKNESHGKFYLIALDYLFFGIYILEICLIGLFFLIRDPNSTLACTAQMVLIIILLLSTLLYQFSEKKNTHKLYKYLPLMLFGESRNTKENEKIKVENNIKEDAKYLQSLNSNKKYDKKDTGYIGRKSGEYYDNIKNLNLKKNDDLFKKERMKDRGQWKHDDHLNEKELIKNSILRKIFSSIVHSGKDMAMFEPEKNSKIVNKDIYTNAPIDLEDLDKEGRKSILKNIYENKFIRKPSPTIWIPDDDYGISQLIIKESKRIYDGIRISNKFCNLDLNNKMFFEGLPPDYDIMKLISL